MNRRIGPRASGGRRPLAAAFALLGAGLLLALPAFAQPGDRAPAQPQATDRPEEPEEEAPSIATSLPPALADPGGARSFLRTKGIKYSLTYIGEVQGNASGGLKRDAVYHGRFDLQVDADLEKLAGLTGLAFHANAFQIHGRGLSACCVGNLLAASNIEATPNTRLFELWLEQSALDGKLALRAGQLAADSEFLISEYGGLFLNGTFGWPAITAANLPNGGPAYPLATPGARLLAKPAEGVTVMAAVFNGDPAGPNGLKDPQLRDRSGLEFRTTDPALVIAEAAYAYNRGENAAFPPGTVKLGGWHHFGRFDSPRFDAGGLSLADPASSGFARRLQGDSGIYAVLDQLVYRLPGTKDSGIGVFARLSGAPSDRNLVSFYADGGMTAKGLIPGRPDDTFGVAAGYARISASARGFDRDVNAVGFDPATGAALAGRYPIRSSEAVLEATYQAQIVPGWIVQPDFQYIFRPGGNVRDDGDPRGGRVKDAAIFGVRTTIRY